MGTRITIFFLFLMGLSHSLFAQEIPVSERYFSMGIPVDTLKNPRLEEVSGIAFSHIHPNLIYAHTDSGGEAAVYMLDSLGKEIGKIILKGLKNRDWEDIAVGLGPDGKSYIYIAEIGDNLARYSSVYVHRIPEPRVIQTLIEEKAVSVELNYPGGARDAETLMLDPLDKRLYIVSKRDKKNNLYSFSWDQFGNKEEIKLDKHLEFPFSSSVAGDISKDGCHILIKNYFAVYYWIRKEGESLTETLASTPVSLPYVPEPQGEAIAFSSSMKSYFTISEKRFNILPVLYRYPSKK